MYWSTNDNNVKFHMRNTTNKLLCCCRRYNVIRVSASDISSFKLPNPNSFDILTLSEFWMNSMRILLILLIPNTDINDVFVVIVCRIIDWLNSMHLIKLPASNQSFVHINFHNLLCFSCGDMRLDMKWRQITLFLPNIYMSLISKLM